MRPEPLTIVLPKHWKEFLEDLDRILPSQVSLHCLGGFVVEVAYGVPRRTGDIDYIAVRPVDAAGFIREHAGRDSELAGKHRAYLQHVGVADWPEEYETRLIRLNTGLRKLILFALDPYDLALSKLTRNLPKDREDVQALAQSKKLSFAVLQERYDGEMRRWLPNSDRHNLTLELWKDFFLP